MAEPEATDEQLTLLLELQATDHRIRKLRHQLDALPEQQALDEAIAGVAHLEGDLAALATTLERATAEQTTLERDIDTLATRRDAERVRLYDGSVTNQREMSSVEAEIESTERRLEEHEEDLLTVLERVEELEQRRAELEGSLAAARTSVTTAEQARDDAAKGLLAELGEHQAARDRQAGSLPDALLEVYEAAAARGGGTGVGELSGNACTACRIDLSMVDVDALFKGPPLTRCPECRRLLVVR
ncbi:hypothetical protein FTX61_10225 [Nitriliruptoraceae bacterium ZYF776]|nr:hypothetical protein [Profundirhabdus halotolerans]